jgi:hypothetical protein
MSSLSQRAREAADTLVEMTKHYYGQGHKDQRGIVIDPELHDWRPANLRYVADQIDAEAKPAPKLVVVGYAEMGDYYLVDEKTGKQMVFNVAYVGNFDELKAQYGIEVPE